MVNSSLISNVGFILGSPLWVIWNSLLLLVLIDPANTLIAVHAEDHPAFQDAAPPGLYVGSVFHGSSPTWKEPDYRALALKHFNIMTSSIYLPSVWRNGPSQPVDVTAFREVVDFLKNNGVSNILVHGHALLYPAIATQTTWWNEQPTQTVEENMFTYMSAVLQAGQGLVYSWDVVNEAMADNNNEMDEDGVRKRLYKGKAIKEYDAMGSDYIRKAFTFARQSDPNAKLMLTDYGCEEDSLDNDNEKSDRLYRFVSKLLKEGIPIDGVGFQLHVGSDGGNPDYLAIARNFERFRKLGLLLYITEMDVASYSTLDPEKAPSSELARAARFQARVYQRILEVCMAEPACQSFRFWDFAEYNSRVPELRYSWLHPITYDADRMGVYTFPTPFWDINPTNFQPKPAWSAMLEAMMDFSENEGGVYRITSNWNSINSYMGRNGVDNGQGGYFPGPTVGLYELNENSLQWSSLKWRLERVVDSDDAIQSPLRRGVMGSFDDTHVYRIQNLWAQGYLTRDGQQQNDGSWEPLSTLRIDDLQMDWWSQLWIIESRGNEQFTIRNYWSNANNRDYLTRLGKKDETGRYQPTNEMRLQADEDFSSQKWFLERATM